MTNKVNPPPRLRIPKKFSDDLESRAYFEQVNTILFQQWVKTGGSVDTISNTAEVAAIAATDVTEINEELTVTNQNVANISLINRVIVKSASDLEGELSSTTEYFIDGVIDMGSQKIVVPEGGLSISGYNFDLSQLVSANDSYVMFTSPDDGSGNVVLKNIGISVSGTSSEVFNLESFDSSNAIEIISCNFNDCSGLGLIDSYRQYFESGTGRFGGTPELIFLGSMNGARISTSIVRSIDDLGYLFSAGVGLTFSGRFITDINCDLPAIGGLLDFSDAEITNDESLLLQGAFITREGVIDPTDTSIYPNIDANSSKSNWKGNTGLPNTNKYLKASCTTEALTTIAASSTFYPLLGTFTESDESHFDMPANGEFRLLTGFGAFNVNADLVIESTANDVIGVRVTKSVDGGATFPTVVSKIKRQVNNIAGGRDVAFFPVSFIVTLEKNDRLRIEIENQTAANNATMELDSYFIVSEV